MTETADTVVLGLPGNDDLAAALATGLNVRRCAISLHQFPDQETCVRLPADISGCDVILAATLDRPNEKLIALYLASSTARTLGARRVFLVAPYLPYMRQDRCFHSGEGVSSLYIGAWLSTFLDGLVTVDPRLHRIHSLDQILKIPSRIVRAAKPMARWIRENVANPVLVGPDEGCRQWVSEVAHDVPCASFVLNKVRFGDRDVEIRMPAVEEHLECTPVLLDDIVSSGQTMIAAMHRLQASGFGAPVCLGIHALFSQDAYEQLRHLGAQEVVTCNSIRHISNGIDLDRSLALSVRELLNLPLR